MRKGILLVITMLLLDGCSSIKYTKLEPESVKQIPDNKARLIIFRPDSLYGVGQQSPIAVDDIVVGYSVSGTVFHLDIDPGKHTFYIPDAKYNILAGATGGALGALLFGPDYDYKKENFLDIVAKSGQIICIKNWISFNVSGSTDFAVVDCRANQKEIARLDFVKFEK